MQPIFILEDNAQQRTVIARVVDIQLQLHKYNMAIALATDDPQALMDYVANAKEPQHGIYIFDIDLGHQHLNGLDTAVKIRQLDPEASIIFITTHAEMSFLTFRYKIGACDFIVKDEVDHLPLRLAGNLSQIHQSQQEKTHSIFAREQVFQIKTNYGSIEKIPLPSIMFFEAHPSPHKLILHTTNGRIEFYDTLDNIEKSHVDFYRAHRSNVVYIKNVVAVDKVDKMLTMSNGERTIVAGRKIKGLLAVL